MHTENVQELKELLLKTDEEFRQLATQHHELDDRLTNFRANPTCLNQSKSKKSPSKSANSSSRTGWKIYCAVIGANHPARLRHPRSRIDLRFGV